jgi:hypothetical protein
MNSGLKDFLIGVFGAMAVGTLLILAEVRERSHARTNDKSTWLGPDPAGDASLTWVLLAATTSAVTAVVGAITDEAVAVVVGAVGCSLCLSSFVVRVRRRRTK